MYGRNREHAVHDPRIGREPRTDRRLAVAVHQENDISLIQRPAKNDEALVDKLVHEASMLVIQLLIAQTLRPVPRAGVLLVDEKQSSHGS